MRPHKLSHKKVFQYCVVFSIIISISSSLSKAGDTSSTSEISNALDDHVPVCQKSSSECMIRDEDENFMPKSRDEIFQEIEYTQYVRIKKPFGRFLDAGAGENSLKFLSDLMKSNERMKFVVDGGSSYDLGVTDWAAITANKKVAQKLKNKAKTFNLILPMDHNTLLYEKDDSFENKKCRGIIFGNWKNDSLCEGEMFDTILVDYLIGALEPYSPFFQYEIFDRLERHLNVGGRMYVVGLQPIKDRGTDKMNIIARMKQIHDACIILAGRTNYREYPSSWVEKALTKSKMKVVDTIEFSVRYTKSTILAQLKVAKNYIDYISFQPLAEGLISAVDELEKDLELAFVQNNDSNFIVSGFNYLVVAEKPNFENLDAD